MNPNPVNVITIYGHSIAPILEDMGFEVVFDNKLNIISLSPTEDSKKLFESFKLGSSEKEIWLELVKVRATEILKNS